MRQKTNWTEEMLSVLSEEISNPEAAQKLGLSVAAVQKKRTSLGKPSTAQHSRKIKWTEEMIQLLGKVSDKEATQVFSNWGIDSSPTTIQKKRVSLGISSYKK